MEKILNFLKNFIIIVYILLIIFVTICLISYNDFQVTQFGQTTLLPVIDEDLKPDFTIGDLLIIQKNKLDDVKEGDKVFFYRKKFGEVTVNYAPVKSVQYVSPTESTFVVDGDYKFSSSNFMGKVDTITVIPKVGRVLSILQSKWGFLFLGVFPSLVAFLYTLHSVVIEAIGTDDDEEKPKKRKKKKSIEKHKKEKDEDEQVIDDKKEVIEKTEVVENKSEETKDENTKEVEAEKTKENTDEKEETKEETKEDIKVVETDITEEKHEEITQEEQDLNIQNEKIETEHVQESKTEEKIVREEKTEEEKRRSAIEAKMKSMTEEEKRALIKAKLDSMTDEEKRALIEAKRRKLEAEKNKKDDQ